MMTQQHTADATQVAPFLRRHVDLLRVNSALCCG